MNLRHSNGFSREVTAVEEISAVGFDRVAAIVKRFLFLEVAAVVLVWNPVKVGGAKSCLGAEERGMAWDETEC